MLEYLNPPLSQRVHYSEYNYYLRGDVVQHVLEESGCLVSYYLTCRPIALSEHRGAKVVLGADGRCYDLFSRVVGNFPPTFFLEQNQRKCLCFRCLHGEPRRPPVEMLRL